MSSSQTTIIEPSHREMLLSDIGYYVACRALHSLAIGYLAFVLAIENQLQLGQEWFNPWSNDVNTHVVT
eukprot:scaffold852_cov197-Alexandrium_tamarense.AAC.22